MSEPQEGGHITITARDVEAVKARRSPAEQHLEELAEKALALAKGHLAKAGNLSDFLMWHRVSMWSTPYYIGWMVDTKADITAEEIVAERSASTMAKEAALVLELKARLDRVNGPVDQIKVAFKRVRAKYGHSWTYRVLAEFPEGTQVMDPVSSSPPAELARTAVYFEPTTACVANACDDLYKDARDHGGVVFMPNLNVMQAADLLSFTPGGVAEYVLEKTDAGRVKQNAQAHVLVGLLGGYANEPIRVRVSDSPFY